MRAAPRLIVSPRLLITGTLSAMLLATVFMSLVVLPMAHGIDPTGLGTATGITRPDDVGGPSERSDTHVITVPPHAGIEFKLHARAGDHFSYSWSAEDVLYFDFHGEEQGAPAEEFTSHKTGEAASDAGDFEAPFTGNHGWFWRNRSGAPIEVTLTTAGVYAVVGLV
jgi:hypothetical protein